MKKLIFLISMCTFCVSHAQIDLEQRTITFKKQLESDSLTTRQKGREVYKFCNRGMHYNPKKKIEALRVAWPIVMQYNEPDYYWNLYRGQLNILRESGEVVTAIDYGMRMLQYAEQQKNNEWRYEANEQLYLMYSQLGMIDNAIEHLIESKKISIEVGEIQKIIQCNYLLGYNYYAQSKNDSAIHFLKKAIHYSEREGPDAYNAEHYYLLGRTYLRNKNYNRAIEVLDSLKTKTSPESGTYYSQFYHAGTSMYLSHGYSVLGNMDSSKTLFDECKEEYLSFDTSLYYTALFYTGAWYTSIGEYTPGLRMMQELIDSNRNYMGMLNTYFAKAYFGVGQYQKASTHYRDALYRTDSLFDLKKEEITAVMNNVLDAKLTAQKQIDEEKRVAVEIKAESQEEQKNIILICAGFIGLLIAFFGRILYQRYKVIKKQKEEINEQKVQVEEKNNEIIDSIAYAKRIQTAILPPNRMINKHLESSFILYKPKDIVAGDFYWMEPLNNAPDFKSDDTSAVLFAAADCTGHGVPGAMVSVICNHGLNRSVREFGLTDPGKILDKTRELVIKEFEKSEEEVKDGMDIALCSLNGNKVKYAGAHNPLWIFRKGADEVEQIKADKQPIGKYAEEKPFVTHQVELNQGDTFYMFSDGYVDQFGGEKGKKFKSAKFKRLLLSIQNETMQKQKERINQAFEDWRGNLEQVDDVCVIGVRI